MDPSLLQFENTAKSMAKIKETQDLLMSRRVNKNGLQSISNRLSNMDRKAHLIEKQMNYQHTLITELSGKVLNLSENVSKIQARLKGNNNRREIDDTLPRIKHENIVCSNEKITISNKEAVEVKNIGNSKSEPNDDLCMERIGIDNQAKTKIRSVGIDIVKQTRETDKITMNISSDTTKQTKVSAGTAHTSGYIAKEVTSTTEMVDISNDMAKEITATIESVHINSAEVKRETNTRTVDISSNNAKEITDTKGTVHISSCKNSNGLADTTEAVDISSVKDKEITDTIGTEGISKDKTKEENIKNIIQTPGRGNSSFGIHRSKVGFKQKFIKRTSDNRIKSQSLECDDKLTNEGIDEAPVQSNIEANEPTEVGSNRLFSDDRTVAYMKGIDDQPRTVYDWFAYANETSSLSWCRLQQRPPKRGDGVCILLVLDTSEYMRGKAFDTMKTAALKYVNGVQEVAISTGRGWVEDNIGLAVFGGHTRLLQEPTNDYNLIKRLIVEEEPYGYAPVLAGLLMGKCGLHAAPIFSTFGFIQHHRMVIFTTGQSANHKPIPLGFPGVSDDIVSVKVIDRSLKVFYVPVGEPKYNSVLEESVKETNGQILQPSEIHRLIRLSQIVFEAMGIATEMQHLPIEHRDRESIRGRVMFQVSSYPDLHDDCIKLVEEFLKQKTYE